MIVFLLETWPNKERMKWVRDKIYFVVCFMVPNDGRGGLALLWKASVNV